MYLSIYPSIDRSIYLSISVCLSIYLSICQLENQALLRDLLIFRCWQHQKRSNSARILHFLNWTTSKTKQFCETSSIFELDNIKNEAILRDFLQKWKVECSAGSLVPMRFAIFPLHLSKVLSLLPLRRIDARSYEVLHLSRKIILANLQIWCSKMQPVSGNQRPDLLTSLMNMSFVLRLPCEMHLCRSSSNVPSPPSFLDMLQNPHVLLTFDKVHNPLRLSRETTSEPPKVVRTPSVFNILTSKCASRHNGVHFLDIATSKRAPALVCFAHFDFEMCFAPQRRALFRHRSFQKWFGPGVFCTFWLRNVLRATTACKFSFLIWPAGSAPAALASLLLDPPERHIIGKTQCFATFLPFRASASSFFWLFLFSDLLSSTLLFPLPLPISAFHVSILSEAWLLNFLRIYRYIDIHATCWHDRIREYVHYLLPTTDHAQALPSLKRLANYRWRCPNVCLVGAPSARQLLSARRQVHACEEPMGQRHHSIHWSPHVALAKLSMAVLGSALLSRSRQGAGRTDLA